MKWNGEMIICVLSKSLKISRWHGSAAWGETPPPPPLPVLVSVLTLVPGIHQHSLEQVRKPIIPRIPKGFQLRAPYFDH